MEKTRWWKFPAPVLPIVGPVDAHILLFRFQTIQKLR